MKIVVLAPSHGAFLGFQSSSRIHIRSTVIVLDVVCQVAVVVLPFVMLDMMHERARDENFSSGHFHTNASLKELT